MAKLAPYRAKRDFTKTSEPKGTSEPKEIPERKRRTAPSRGALFVVQKHDASRLHYDFRLELDGVLKSWAVAKGPSLVAGEKRLAVHVEDHPLDYGDFECTIPAGEYGGGTVMLWDRGRWEPEGDPHKGYAKGHLSFRVEGERLKGAWHLVRMRKRPKERQESWLLIKSDDEHARAADAPDILEEETMSVKTGRSLEAIADGKASPSRKPRGAGKAPAKPTAPKAKAAPKRRAAPAGKAAPMPSEIQPCLATLVDEVPRGPRWLHEIKWDGYRLVAFLDKGKVRLRTRNGLDWTKRFPAIAKAMAALPVTSAILDGEAVMEDEAGASSFSALQQALSKTTEGIANQAIFYAFDLLHLDGQDMRALPLEQRKARLAELVPTQPGSTLRLSEHLDSDGAAMVSNACRLGLEGVVSKRRDLPYRSGRNEDWVKTKCTARQEFVIAGFVPSTATKSAVGSLVLGYYEKKRLVYAGRTGTGFTADSARDLFKRLERLKEPEPPFADKLPSAQRRGVTWVRPELIGEVEFRGWTADKVVRHAAFKGLREDKSAGEVVQETRRRSPTKGSSSGTKAGDGSMEVAGVRLTHPDRVLWEEQGITKQGLAEFYLEIADWILPHLVDRPLSLVRCPSGAQKGCFFQKHSWAGLTDVIQRETVRDESGEEEVLLLRDIRGVIALVQAGVLEIHPWGTTIAHIERPDRITFDFDPSDEVAWTTVIESARELRERLSALGLESFPKTTGGKGLHVVVPLAPKADWDTAKGFARDLSETMEADNPGLYLTKATKRERKGKIFIDYLRNARGATAVAAYSTRARPGAPVSTPLGWDELSASIKSNHFTVANLTARLDALRKGPWREMAKLKQTLPAATKAVRSKGRR